MKPSTLRTRTFTHLLPAHVEPWILEGTVTIVIDVLRATTTIAWALGSGAARVLPVLEPADATSLRDRLEGRERVILGGERMGVRIEGFHLGNSPRDYDADRVDGRTIVFTTTNGTRALAHARKARRVLAGSFACLSAVARVARSAAAEQTSDVHLLCAGTDGGVTLEDVLVAGALAERLSDDAPAGNDETLLALHAWRHVASAPGEQGERIARAMRDARGGVNLVQLGFERDIRDASIIDHVNACPELVTGQDGPALVAAREG
ncbi:MAG: 2-phosphosulfolactate phosphatase [Planctomycetota bacterium]|nr:2-phosphosulfolactate phosphatase [Planctomycetota bacterium]